MKTFFWIGGLVLLFLSSNTMAQEEEKQIKVKITGENGAVIEKEYSSAEALENDPELKEMGIDVEAENGRIRMKSSGNGKQSVVIQQSSGNGNFMHIQQGSHIDSGADSLRRPPHPSMDRKENDSFHREEYGRRMELRDSLLSQRDERREERIKEMEERRAEMRRRMEERRSGHRAGRQLIIIENLSKKEATQLGIKNENLDLEDLKITPDPATQTLELAFSSDRNAPVQIKFSDTENNLLLDETHPLQGNNFGKAFQLKDLEEGIYFLQIIQDKKSLSRKIRIE